MSIIYFGRYFGIYFLSFASLWVWKINTFLGSLNSERVKALSLQLNSDFLLMQEAEYSSEEITYLSHCKWKLSTLYHGVWNEQTWQGKLYLAHCFGSLSPWLSGPIVVSFCWRLPLLDGKSEGTWWNRTTSNSSQASAERKEVSRVPQLLPGHVPWPKVLPLLGLIS